MGRRARRVFTPEQRTELWERYRRGESLKSIGRIFEKDSGAIYGVLSRTGGIAPPPRKRSKSALTWLIERKSHVDWLQGYRSAR